MKVTSTTVLAAITILAVAAQAQTTKPADSEWGQTVQTVATALTAGDATALAAFLAEDAAVQSFDRKAEDVTRLLTAAAKGVRIGAHPYVHPPRAMAADIAADVKNSTLLPDSIKRQMIPQDDTEMARANATAVQWVTDTLAAKPGNLVGVVMLWCARPAVPGAAADATTEMEVVWVMFRGEETSPGKFSVKLIVFGQPSLPRE